MLARLKAIHEELLAGIKTLEAVVQQSTPDVAGLTNARWKLSRASFHRRKFLVDHVYPALDRLPSSDSRGLEDLRTAGAAMLSESARHIAAWSTEQIVRDWPGYQRASMAVRAAMRNRIAAEKAILYPLLEAAERAPG
ncbi:MAG: hypothetical protein V4475_00345 [Pseudomonadota bacterium]